MIHADLEKPAYRNWIEFLRGSENWDRNQIRAYQTDAVRRMLERACDNAPAYREIYDQAGVTPRDFQKLEDLRRFPFVEKEMIRDRLEAFSVPMAGRSYITTGGSTGIPFGMYRDPDAFPKELASKAYQYYRVGWQEGDRQMVLRGLPIDTPDHTVFVPEYCELRCSSYHLLPEQMEIYRQKAWEYRPEWLRCYPSSGALFARWLEETGRPFPQLKGILCASENLYDFQKEQMRRIFGARVFSHYGHYELAALAGFCERADTYHVLPQYGYVELIAPDGSPVTEAGQAGEIVATSFLMQATPFIRYRTRDIAVLQGEECPLCGRPYQVWSRVEGRLQEFVVTAGGRFISMTAMNFHDDIFDVLKQFQFYQDTPGAVVFRYIPKQTGSSAGMEEIQRRLLKKLGDDIRLTLEEVAEIPFTPRGKTRFLVQKLPIAFHDYDPEEPQ